jgi:hypothetical protein
MASASDIIQAIIQLGTVVKSSAAKSGSQDWTTVLGSILNDPATSKAVSALFNQIKGHGIDDLISAVRDKENAILKKTNAKDASSLNGQDLLDYHSLADAELALATQELVDALNGGFLDWLIDDALPALTKILPLVMAL